LGVVHSECEGESWEGESSCGVFIYLIFWKRTGGGGGGGLESGLSLIFGFDILIVMVMIMSCDD
jgi:hypothetical protein